MVGNVVQVADRRRWQSAMTSPIGDVGSERVKSDLINNMDHRRISGTEPSSVILSQAK